MNEAIIRFYFRESLKAKVPLDHGSTPPKVSEEPSAHKYVSPPLLGLVFGNTCFEGLVSLIAREASFPRPRWDLLNQQLLCGFGASRHRHVEDREESSANFGDG